MNTKSNRPQKIILDLQKLNELNSQGYAGKFSLGETVVLACAGCNESPRYINERDAIYDKTTNSYWDRNFYDPKQKS